MLVEPTPRCWAGEKYTFASVNCRMRELTFYVFLGGPDSLDRRMEMIANVTLKVRNGSDASGS